MFNACLYHVNLPMKVSFEHLAAMRNFSDSLVLQLNLDDIMGLGECAPRSYVTNETSENVCQALLDLSMPKILTILRTRLAIEILDELKTQGFEKTFKISSTNNLICLLELTILDWLGKKLQLPGQQLFSYHKENTTDQPIRISQVLDNSLSVEEFISTRGPFHFIKIKGSPDINKDIEIVRTLRKHIDSAIPIMIDANMNWNFDDALIHLKKLHNLGVNYVEEPLTKGSWRQLGELRQRTGMPIMLDESICTLQDANIAVQGHYCDAINVRIAKCGGVFNATKIIELARKSGVAFQIGVQVAECGPLINAGRILAANNSDAITVEAGQCDRFFQRMIVQPSPSVDRNLNVFSRPTGFGLGLEITNEIEQFEVYNFSHVEDKWKKSLLPRHQGVLS